jgi:hypothetical protein
MNDALVNVIVGRGASVTTTACFATGATPRATRYARNTHRRCPRHRSDLRGRVIVARIKIDLDRRLGRVDRRMYGSFIEHLGRCIYGGVVEDGSPLADERGSARTSSRPPAHCGSRFCVGRAAISSAAIPGPTESVYARSGRDASISPGAARSPTIRHRRVHRVLPRAGSRAVRLRQRGLR